MSVKHSRMSRASTPVIDPVELTRDLIRIPSVTPADEGAMDVLERHLTTLGFTCRRLAFEGPGGEGVHARIENLYARRGTASPRHRTALGNRHRRHRAGLLFAEVR